jgi:hypothetical protein
MKKEYVMEKRVNPLEMVDFEKTISDDTVRTCKIKIKGSGSAFTQGVITLEDYYIIKQYQESNDLDEIEAWERAIDGMIEGFESEKYFTDNLKSFFQGIHLIDNPTIEIWIDDEIRSVVDLEEIEDYVDEINVSKDGNKICTLDDVGKISATYIEYKKDLVISDEFEFKGRFNAKEFQLIVGHSDEVAVGNRIKDFLLGFKYEDNICDPYLKNNSYKEYSTDDSDIIYSLIYENEIN